MQQAPQILNFNQLSVQQSRFAETFATADPIRHIVIDGFLEAEVALQASRAFPAAREMEIAFAGLAEVKNADQRLARLDPVFGKIFEELRTSEFLEWLRAVTQISDLVDDPELHGSGLHQGADGSFLDVHADFNVHPRLRLYRRLNLLIYLNETWQPTWQGYLELWSRDMTECRQYIEPKFNRCVIMETHDHAFHGYKELRLPSGVTRKSLASYYYSADRSESQTSHEHDTLFQLRPEQRNAKGPRLFFRRLIALSPAPMRPLTRALRALLRIKE
ncbi:MAG: 2OG-Fe(II) oxygenase [Candidatus Eremiobacteraeota bacterium]|nr:2OG-Fe(II) oxygenase [Candidatus Eremiobacteraeota bacterium]MBV9973377.1 2OG-Fe(II) oxygenase [Candidatus Eremiobacteraeota bacterium]